jgi:phenylalanyl-tRNA synthetase beta chain
MARDFGLDENNLVEIANPLSAEQQYLKRKVYPGIINNVKENLKYFEKLRIFELGKEYSKKGKGIIEKRVLSGAITDKTQSKNTEKEEFYELKGVLETLFKECGIADVSYKKASAENPFALADINLKKENVGFIGLAKGINFFEIDFEKLQNFCVDSLEYKQISQHPTATRDIAVLVPREALVEEVLRNISAAGGLLLKNVETFDVYEGEELAGKKSLAFHIVFQAEDRTLKPEEINSVMNNIINVIEGMGWEIRR